MNALTQAIRWAKGQAPKNNPVKRRNTRVTVSSFTEDSSLSTYGSFIWGVIKNTVHTSHTDHRTISPCI
ncbi:hypothetical protein I7I50_08874 [Histoplasma capsulatum G186AR]|uniref:Uncharacterized protein n=1 Tax=Ajellomyces capsulatus TaxID=5037 RepID=A0A8H8CZI7_AJECA|nr:hypothetical protein I7I52_06390 [Histoplasma capsulatum]QSS73923.1 hypothetical protein I7I50_08874 [Histoplasma capsulatum G186AR]